MAGGADWERQSYLWTAAITNLLVTAKASAIGVWISTATAVIPCCAQERQSWGLVVVAEDAAMASAPVERQGGQSALSALPLSRKALGRLPEFLATNVEPAELQIPLKPVLMQTQQGQVSTEAQAMGSQRRVSALCPAYHQTLQEVL